MRIKLDTFDSQGSASSFQTGRSFATFSGFQGEVFGPNFGFPYMFYTFKLLPQLKIGRSQPADGDFFSQIALLAGPWTQICNSLQRKYDLFIFKHMAVAIQPDPVK